MSVLDFLLKPQEQKDWIVDMYWNIMGRDDRNKIITQISKLPVLSYLDDIIYAVKDNAIVIIEAQTGSWKTTQIWKIAPFIDLWKRWLNKVNMTQPRVLAATSNASRISQELLAQVNDPSFTLWYKVGYMTGVSENYSPETKLLLTTDGAELMRQMISWIYPDILILDEAHVYTQYLELLFALAKKWKSKVIIMTATMDKDLILDYFRDVSKDIPYFDVPWRVHNITEHVRKQDELIPTILDFHNKTWWSWLIFHPWKWPLYDTIEKVKTALKQEEVEWLISDFEFKSKELLLTPFVEIKNKLEEKFKDKESHILIDKIINLDEIKKILLFLKKQFETKYKNPNFTLEKEKFFLDWYYLFSTESFNENIEKEILLLKKKEKNKLNINVDDDELNENNEVIETKYNNMKNIFKKELTSLLKDEYYSVFLAIVNKMIDKLDLIDDIFDDFIREVNTNIIWDWKRIQKELISAFNQKLWTWYEKEKEKFQESFFRNNSLLSLEWFLYSLKKFFYDLNINWKNSRKLALKVSDIDKYLANDKIKQEFLFKIKNIWYLFSNETWLTEDDLEKIFTELNNIFNSREFEIKIVAINSLILDLNNYQDIFISFSEKFNFYKKHIEEELFKIKNNLLSFISKKDFEKLFWSLFDDLDDLLKDFSNNNIDRINNKIEEIKEKIIEEKIEEKIEENNFDINFSFSNQKRISSYKNLNKNLSLFFKDFLKSIDKKEKRKYSWINSEKILHNIFDVIIDNKEKTEHEIYNDVLNGDDLFWIFNNSLEEKNVLDKERLKKITKNSNEYKNLENSILSQEKILKERNIFIENITKDYKEYLVNSKNDILKFILDIKKREKDYVMKNTLDSKNIINSLNLEEIKKGIDDYQLLYKEKQEVILKFNKKIEKFNLLKKDFLDELGVILNNKLDWIKNKQNIINSIIREIEKKLKSTFLSFKDIFINSIKNNWNYKNKNIDFGCFIDINFISNIIKNSLEENIDIIEDNNQNEKNAISDIEKELNIFIEKEFKDLNYHEKFLEIFHSKIDEIESKKDIDNIVVPLHSDLSIEEAERYLAPWQKIRNATNAAEMSMTINWTSYVVDTWTEKVIILDETWVETLVTRPISKASAKQRKWRTWREWPWEYIWIWPKDIDSLEDFSDTEIQRTAVSRIMLMTLAAWENIKNIKLLHPIPDYIIDLWDKKLRNLWAKDKDWKITDIGEFILMIPTDERIWRMIYEWVKRDCVWDLINIAWILEAKDFLESHNKRYKKIKFEWLDYRKTNDLYFLSKMFDLITSASITEIEYNQFIRLWINKIELDNFEKLDNENKMLYEEVDLSLLWVKDKYIQETIIKINQIKKSLDELWIKYEKKDDFENKDLLYSVLTAYKDNIFSFSKKDSKFVNKEKWFFDKAWISSVDETSGKFFIWYPFRIKDLWKEKAFLSRIIKVDENDLKEVFKNEITNWETKISLWTKVFKVPWKRWKKIARRKIVLMQTKTAGLWWVELSDINYEIWKDSFEYMFKNVYLPNLLVKENYKFISFIEEMKENAPKWEKLNYSKFNSLISKYVEWLYDYFENSKKNIKKIENYFRNDETVYENFIKSEDSQIISFLLEPYIKE